MRRLRVENAPDAIFSRDGNGPEAIIGVCGELVLKQAERGLICSDPMNLFG